MTSAIRWRTLRLLEASAWHHVCMMYIHHQFVRKRCNFKGQPITHSILSIDVASNDLCVFLKSDMISLSLPYYRLSNVIVVVVVVVVCWFCCLFSNAFHGVDTTSCKQHHTQYCPHRHRVIY